MSLDESVATAAGWASKIQGHARVKGWYNRNGDYVGIGLPDWSSSLSEAFTLLRLECWTLATCDNGYVCRIHEAPERGEGLRGEGIGKSVAVAICRAYIAARKIV